MKLKQRENSSAVHENELIEVYGARVHNLRNIDVSFPRNKMIVITGLSGSGKSSLAFDTIYAEGQRRYIESFSAYARQFLGNMERPDVDKITGLSPVISIEQRTTNQNPRSTVGTVTEIYDYLRVLYARASRAFSYVTGKPMVRFTDDQIMDAMVSDFSNMKIHLLAPLVRARKGHYRDLFEQYIQLGFIRMRIDGELVEMKRSMQIDRYKSHNIELVVDQLLVTDKHSQRLIDSLGLAMKYGKGTIMILDAGSGTLKHFSRNLMCAESGIAYDEPAPNTFSFNSPYGSCITCHGLGTIHKIDKDSLLPKGDVSIRKGGIAPLGEYWDSWAFKQIQALGHRFGFDLDTPVGDLSDEAINALLSGTDDPLQVKSGGADSSGKDYKLSFPGIVKIIQQQLESHPTESFRKWASNFMEHVPCHDCHGTRLRKESLHFRINGLNIAEICNMDLRSLCGWFDDLPNHLEGNEKVIATEVIGEIRKRLGFMVDVGLEYLSLDRPSKTLSGGEAQRIRLATQIGSQLVGVLYILDEPSIGLHQRDNRKLIKSLQELRDLGNSVIVVEHDKETIQSADFVIDLGPGAGVHGGRIVAKGVYNDLIKTETLTTQYLTGKKSISPNLSPRKGNGKFISLKGASGHNLKKINIILPLGKFIVVSGVSGSGKSSLINETLYPVMHQYFYRTTQKPLPHSDIEGLSEIDKVIEVDQSPIGRTPRSNPATYTGVFTDIRNLFASLPESQIRGYAPGRFSFNVKGGRCETCHGGGVRIIEMNFLPDVSVECETCSGLRYNRETLEVRYKGKSISDILNLTIEDALDFFSGIPSIVHKIKTLEEVGLGYLTLGQRSTTLSGGEAQRVKLASELSKKDTGNTFYILDEPTTGLHFDDVRILLSVLNRLVDKGNTVLVIEHNLDIIKAADHIIDLGPEGGFNGGELICEGTLSDILRNSKSHTAKFLREESADLHSIKSN
jgi:excinuclease ABC subunit A